ncbi:transposase family protein (plasmid) [Burkholderia thailandensis 34]|nr:transposase family protein [Burkholderia thailandensis 34]AOJ58532.1 transposase [Burkholderia thailandensis]KXF59768.1 transposase [Burkholderia thailandensis]
MLNERGHVHMNEQEEGLRGRLVVDRKRDGRRKYDEAAKRELIQACLKPGVSIARTAMEHGINPNLVRTWITQHQRKQDQAELRAPASAQSRETPPELPTVSLPPESAFVQVVSPPAPIPADLGMTLSLNVRLPNGVEIDLGEAGLEELTTIVQMLGRLPCSGSTKR